MPGRWWTINGHLFPNVPMYMVEAADVVVMRIENHSGKSHPMHLHGHHAVVLSRDAVPSTDEVPKRMQNPTGRVLPNKSRSSPLSPARAQAACKEAPGLLDADLVRSYRSPNCDRCVAARVIGE